MGQLTQNIIEVLKFKTDQELIEENLWIAGDLLAKYRATSYYSGFSAVDSETVSQEEFEELKQALLNRLQSSKDPKIISVLIGEMSKSGDKAYKQIYFDNLQKSLELLKVHNGVVYQCLIALDYLKEDVLERDEKGGSSQSLIEVDKNIRQAHNYLLKHNIIPHW